MRPFLLLIHNTYQAGLPSIYLFARSREIYLLPLTPITTAELPNYEDAAFAGTTAILNISLQLTGWNMRRSVPCEAAKVLHNKS
jgi:hypothetical protein